MTNQVSTLETCQSLRKAGFPQEKEFVWVNHAGQRVVHRDTARELGLIDEDVLCAAPILTEVLEQLPKKLDGRELSMVVVGSVWWYAGHPNDKGDFSVGAYVADKNPAEAAAQLWLELNGGGRMT